MSPNGKVQILSAHIRSNFLLMKHDHNTPEHWMVRQRLESKGGHISGHLLGYPTS
jgi:hypothetical protein